MNTGIARENAKNVVNDLNVSLTGERHGSSPKNGSSPRNATSARSVEVLSPSSSKLIEVLDEDDLSVRIGTQEF